MTDENGDTRMHSIDAPIVDGAGKDLPGLFGLRTLERERAILDCGQQMLHLFGKGEAAIELLPGSTSIPLKKGS